jgi:hypothetical protein
LQTLPSFFFCCLPAAACVQVLFHAPTHKLISASEDGLVAVHDVAAGLNQDDGFIAALSVGTSVLQLGMYGPGGQHMWCRTGAGKEQGRAQNLCWGFIAWESCQVKG